MPEQRSMFRRIRGPKWFYGWWIVTASTLVQGLYGAVYFYGFGTFFMPLLEEFKASRLALSGAFAFCRIEGMLLGPLEGWLVDKFGPRKMMVIGASIMAAGYLLLSHVNSLIMFYVVFIGLAATGATLGLHTPVFVAVTNWFIRKRSRAMGLLFSGLSLSGIALPGLAWLIGQHGWRTASAVIGVVILAVCLPLSTVMRRRPEQYGLLPDGDTAKAPSGPPAHSTGATSDSVSKAAAEVNFTWRQALKVPAFWMLGIVFGLGRMTAQGIVVHQIPLVTGMGISAEWAAATLGSLAIVSVVGRLGFGWLGDFWDKRYVMAVSLVLMIAGIAILAYAQHPWQIVLFLAVYAPGYGGRGVMQFALRGEYFGREQIGTISGFMGLVEMLGTVSGPLFAGYIYDLTGSYRVALLTFASALLVATVLMLVTRPHSVPAAQTPGAKAGKPLAA